ncbi:helix-turn-helix domain-containing protein [bacterium]|nr:helix-turn-helix domain-containing protein [bacterium]
MTLGEKIQYLRTQKNISQEDLAASIGVSRQAISKWETDQSTPDLENMRWLSEYFQVELSSLIEEEDIVSQKESSTTKSNTLLRVSRFLFIGSIGMSCWFVIVMIFLITFQDVFFWKTINHTFAFPIPSFILNMILCGILVGMNIFLWKETRKASKGLSMEIAFLIVSIVLPFFVQWICSTVETQVIASFMALDKYSLGSSYSYIVSYIGVARVIYQIGLMLFIIGTSILLSAKHISKKGYVINHKEKPYSFGYGFLSFVLGLISLVSIPLTSYWIHEIKQIDLAKGKNMQVPFIVGVCLQGFAWLLTLLILILLKVSIH